MLEALKQQVFAANQALVQHKSGDLNLGER